MTLISLLLVLALERSTHKTRYWQAEFYVDQYLQFLQNRNLISAQSNLASMAIAMMLPALVVGLLLYSLDAFLLEFIVNTAILMVCIGCPLLRESYRGYLQAASRGDTEATHLYAEQLGYPCDSNNSFGQCLVWINYRHYIAVSVWFIALGGAGAMFYVLTRAALGYLSQQQSALYPQWQKVMDAVDWIPARLSSLGLLVVGHFSRALPVWLGHAFDLRGSARSLVTDVAEAAEYVEDDNVTCTEAPCTMVRLVKRNMMFLLVVVAVLTLGGVLR